MTSPDELSSEEREQRLADSRKRRDEWLEETRRKKKQQKENREALMGCGVLLLVVVAVSIGYSLWPDSQDRRTVGTSHVAESVVDDRPPIYFRIPLALLGLVAMVVGGFLAIALCAKLNEKAAVIGAIVCLALGFTWVSNLATWTLSSPEAIKEQRENERLIEWHEQYKKEQYEREIEQQLFEQELERDLERRRKYGEYEPLFRD